jgi:hypothetical protein
MTDLIQKNYREQPELKCCANCKHQFCTYDVRDPIGCHLTLLEVDPAAVCDSFQSKTEQP